MKLTSRILISSVFALLLVTLATSSADVWGAAHFYLFAAALVLLGLAPWVNEPGRKMHLIILPLISLAFAIGAWQLVWGWPPLPHECSGRGKAGCELQNLLYAVGGRQLAAAPYIALAALTIYLSIKLGIRRHKSMKPPDNSLERRRDG